MLKDMSKDKVEYVFPPMDLLNKMQNSSVDNREKTIKKAKIIEETFKSFGIGAKVVKINKGPTVTCFELQPERGVKVSRIVNLTDDLSLALASSGIRIQAPIPGKSVVGIEVANDNKEAVFLREIVESEEFKKGPTLPLALGKSITGDVVISDISKMPHLLIAGSTGSGKSVCINTIIMSLLYKTKPQDLKLILIDPKMVELSIYNGIPHLAIPVVTNPKKASFALYWAVREMERRYKIFSENLVKDIGSYRERFKEDETKEQLPYIVIIIDELADLMMVSASEVEDHIARLAQMARACGIHLIIATQRPSVDVITGTIKTNIPSRISFAVSSQIDSRTILDMSGAEKLLGKGDMLFYPSSYPKPKRLQGAFVSDKEVANVVKFLKENNNSNYDENIIENIESNEQKNDEEELDELYNEAVELAVEENTMSISMLQRKLKIGYARAGRIIDQMESNGVIGGHEGSKPRKVLITNEDLQKEHEL